jgi:predicted porin
MKKTALSLAIAAVLPAFANAEKVEVELPEFYGKVNISVQNTQEGDESISEVSSNASRLGVKGKIDLKHGIQAVYQAEYEMYIDDGDNGGKTFKQRNTFGGFKGDFGQLIIGNFDTPMKKAQKKIDLFNDLEGDIKSAITDSDNRTKNTVQYNTPNVAGFVATVAHIASESETINDGTSSSLSFSNDGLYAAIAYDTDVNLDTDVLRLVAQYSIADLTLGGLWEQDNRAGDSNDNEGWVYSAAYKINSDITLKAQYGESDIVKDDAKTYSLGADYKLAKAVKVYAFVTDEEFGDNSSNEYYGVGTEFKF